MITIFYYIYNNLNNSYIIVSHHEAERAINISITNVPTISIEIEYARIITTSIIVTAAQHEQTSTKRNIVFKFFPT